MNFDKDKVDECTLALLYLVMHNEDKYGARAWKGFDWDTMNRLHDKGYIDSPVGKAKSVFIFPEGVKKQKNCSIVSLSNSRNVKDIDVGNTFFLAIITEEYHQYSSYSV